MGVNAMEWTDTLMFAPDSSGGSSKQVQPTKSMRVMAMEGLTLLCANVTSRSETTTALEALRDFRATGRRVVLCDTSRLTVGRQFGCEVVEKGTANLIVSCGISGREVGIGARDAGLDLSSVVVCSQPLAGGQVLTSHITPGDTVLLLGIDEKTCDALAHMLEYHLSIKSSAAA